MPECFERSHFAVDGGTLYWYLENPATRHNELRRSDGALLGTRAVASFVDLPGQLQSCPDHELYFIAGRRYFAGTDASGGVEPWISDGTENGTRPLGDVAPGPSASFPREFTLAGSTIYFTADDGSRGRELWAVPIEPAPVQRRAFPTSGS